MSKLVPSTLVPLTAALLLGCGGKAQPPPGPGGGGGGGGDVAGGAEVEIAIASVTLADDCPDGRGPDWSLPPPAPVASTTAADEAPAPKPTAGSMQDPSLAGPGSASVRRLSMSEAEAACEQSFVQLQVTGKAGAGRFAIRKIELLDDAGKVLGELTARTPTRWQDDHYEPWTEQVEAGATTSAAYELSAPDWSKYGMSRSDAEGRVFNVRLTVSAGDDERTVEQQATVAATSGPVVLPPGAVT